MASLSDFSLVKASVSRFASDFSLQGLSQAFQFFVLNLILNLQDDEILDSITDNHYLTSIGDQGGHDRGIDAVYIDESNDVPIVHLFNFKYTENFDNTKKFFPAGEIDKIVNFINSLMNKDEGIKDTINPVLYQKVKEIWNLFDKSYPNFVIHISSNYYLAFETAEKQRFEREIRRHSNFSVFYHLMESIVDKLVRRGKIQVDAKIKAIDTKLFEKSDGDIRALIVNIDSRDLIRIVLDDDAIRKEANLEDYGVMKNFKILEDAFEDNVRIYLKQKSRINQNIKNTVLSEDNHRFFYFNNGVTLTCASFKYPKTVRGAVIELKNIQVVNGGQTVHALYEAFLDNSEKLEHVDILCRIYETQDSILSVKIAEYTNSQNPVRSRDVRSIDYIQQKIEQEFKAMGFFYERKVNQYVNKTKKERIDAEKSGQVMMAFNLGMPYEAKNRKGLIFGERYEDLFDDDISAEKILLPLRLFELIEDRKSEIRKSLDYNEKMLENEGYIIYASYFILYTLAKLAETKQISFSFQNLEKIWVLYESAKEIVLKSVEKEKMEREERKEDYTHANFFKTAKPRKMIDDLMLESNET